MSSYHKGNPHKIAAMASKSCNAVSARDLYVPMQADVTADTGNRTYEVVITAFCYFGTRINIENIFHDMTINGTPVANHTINGWVSKDEPGKQIATLTLTGTYNAEGKPSQKDYEVSLFGQMAYYRDIGCTDRKEIPFQNTIVFQIPDIEPHYTQPATPVIDSVTSLEDALLINLHTTSFGEGGGRYLYIECSKTSDFATMKVSEKIDTLSGTVRISNLQVNTKYYIRAVAANNGASVTGVSQEAATLASSEFSYVRAEIPSGAGRVKYGLRTFAGGSANSWTSYGEFSKDGGTTWTVMNSSTSTLQGFTGVMSGTQAGDVVLLRTRTVTNAGTFISAPVEYTVPGTFYINITGVSTPAGGTAKVTTSGSASGCSGTTKTDIYYRPYGMEEEWVLGGTINGTNGTVTLTGLNPNYAEYEVEANLTRGTCEYDSQTVKFFTVPSMAHNDTCDSLDYLVQLICQTYNAIKQGNITVYMNDDTKKWCEGEDGIPTLAAIMSRVNRYMHAVGCILCSMEGFIELLKEAEPNQVFMGQLGWVDCDEVPTEGSQYPVLSSGVHAAIDELIHQVWHYAGEYDYYAYNPLELNTQSGTATGQTAVMGDKKYKWNGSSWVEDGEPVMENFGVIHINYGRHADKAYYWFVDGWNRLDADTDEIEARLEALESINVVTSLDVDKDYKIATFADTGNVVTNSIQIDTTIPTDVQRNTLILITQPERQNEQHLIVYDDGDGNPIP